MKPFINTTISPKAIASLPVVALHAFMIVGLILGCSAGGSQSPNSRISGGSSGGKLDGSNSNEESNSTNNDPNDPNNPEYCNTHMCQSDNNQTQISGVNLVSFDNIRPRCDFTSPKRLNYDIYCRAVAIQKDLTEVLITPVTMTANPHIALAWTTPVIQSGSVSNIKCTIDNSSLGQACNVLLPTTSPTTLDFGLIASDSNLGKRNQSKATISLPFSVGVSAGMVANAAMGYNVGAGFSPITYQPKDLLINPTSICTLGSRTFFTSGSSIWELDNDKKAAKTFAGSFHNGVVLAQNQTEDFSSRFGIQLGTALGLACYVDAGNHAVVLVSDATKNRILKITETKGDPNDPIAVVQLAGSKDGTGGYAGDGGTVTSALINLQVTEGPWATSTNPAARGIAIIKSSDGKDCQSIVFADTGNHRIRKISSCDENGVVTSIAGTGVAGFTLDGTAAKNSAIDAPQYIAVSKDGSIYFSTIFGPEAMVALYPNQTTPAGFVAIRKIKLDGKLSTELGPKSASWDSAPGTAMSLPQLPDLDFGGVPPIVGMAVANDGTLYASAVTGQYNYGIIRKSSNGAITLIPDVNLPSNSAGGDPSTVEQKLLSATQGLAIDTAGNLLVADQSFYSKGIRLIGSTDTQLSGINATTIGRSYWETFGDSLAQNTRLKVNGMAFDENHNIIATSDQNSIRQIFTAGTRNGNICTRFGMLSVDGNNPNSLSAMTYLANRCDTTTSAPNKRTYSSFTPTKIAVGINGSIYFTSAQGDENLSHKIFRLDATGGVAVVAGSDTAGLVDGVGTTARFRNILSIAMGPDQVLYVADAGNHRIRKLVFAANGTATVSTVAGKPSSSGAVFGFSGDGGLATNALLNTPVSIAVDPATPATGKAPVLYFIDQANARVRSIDANGNINSVFGAVPSVDLIRSNGDAAATKNAVVTIKILTTAAEFTASTSGLTLFEGTEVSLSTSSKLPTGVLAGRRYFIANLKKGVTGISTFNLTVQLPNGNPPTQFLTASGTQSGVHTLTIPQPLFTPKEIVVPNSGEIFVVDSPQDTRYRLNQIKLSSAGAWALKQLFPVVTKDGTIVAEQMQMCGMGKINNTAASTNELRVKIQASLATMCVGSDIVALAAKNTCNKAIYPNASQQRISIAFAQRFLNPTNNAEGADNIIQLQMPCDN